VVERQLAESIAAAYVRDLPRQGSPKCVLLPAQTLEEAFGWVFFYQSREYVETGRSSAKLATPAPLLILRKTGELRVLGTDLPVENYLVQYRAALPKPVDPRWLRVAFVPWAIAGVAWLVSAAAGARFDSPPSGWLTVFLGLCIVWMGGLTYFDIGGVGGWTANYAQRSTPWKLGFPFAPFFGAGMAIIGAGFIAMGIALLAGLPTNWHA
jgi:hypothetical protein